MIAGAFAFGIGRSFHRSRSKAPVRAPLVADQALFSGCASIRWDGTCELTKDRNGLRVWIPGDASRVIVRQDGQAVLSTPIAEGGGALLELHPDEGARVVEVFDDGHLLLRALLAAGPEPPALLVDGRRLRNEGKLDEAESKATALIAADDPAAHARGLGLKARIALSRGDAAAVDRAFAAVLDADAHAGLASDFVDDAAAWVFSLQQRSRLVEASAVLDRASTPAHVYPEGAARLDYYRGDLAGSLGHPRRALGLLRDAARRAGRMGALYLSRIARQDAARVDVSMGRTREGLDDLVAMLDHEGPSMSACEKADVEANIATLASQVEGAPHGDPGVWIADALKLFHDGCPAHDSPQWTMSLMGARARAALDQGDLDGARRFLTEARAKVPHPPPETEVEWLSIEGRVAKSAHDAKRALRLFEAMEAIAATIDARDHQREALEMRAEVLASVGDPRGALSALDAATALTDAQSVEIPIGEGRESYLRASEKADARRIELLASLGRPAAALAHLRRARARVLATLVRGGRLEALDDAASGRWAEALGAYRRERDAIDKEASEDWTLATSTLTERRRSRAARAAAARGKLEAALAGLVGEASRLEPAHVDPDTTILAIDAGAARWIGFVAEGDRVRAQPLDSHPDKLLAPFAPEIARAKRLAIVTFGDAQKLDVHALPFRGAPLIDTVPVVYPLDAPHPARPDAGTRDALVVGDPTSDLAAAREEATQVDAALSANRHVTLLRGDDASGNAVRDALAKASLFHYAGHGIFAGRDGWESALPLAEHAQLAISDVLALPRVPATVVLGGCETARASGEAQAEGLGIAQAFVVAGAEYVVAATRVVDDSAAAAMARAFYAHLGAGDDVPEALRQAQRELAAAGVKDWAAFRVLVP